jgi:hypothetical protein
MEMNITLKELAAGEKFVLKAVRKGLYVVENAYSRDEEYFSPGVLGRSVSGTTPADGERVLRSVTRDVSDLER